MSALHVVVPFNFASGNHGGKVWSDHGAVHHNPNFNIKKVQDKVLK